MTREQIRACETCGVVTYVEQTILGKWLCDGCREDREEQMGVSFRGP